MRHWLLKHRQASFTQVAKTGDDQRPSDCGYDEARFEAVTELDREPGEFDDLIDGQLVHNPMREANTKAGAGHIAAAHAQKRVEAVLIASGFALSTGLLSAEAARRGIPLTELAAIVLERAAAFADAELERQEPDIVAKRMGNQMEVSRQ